MTLNLTMPKVEAELKPRITVVGCGGAGGNAVSNMIRAKLEGVEFVVANTDSQSLAQSLAERRVQLGVGITQGLGAGSRPEIGRAAAEEAINEILDHLAGSHMVFIAAGMGGGTGTGAAPVIARAAREHGVLTVGVVTKPFHFEGQHRMKTAETGIEELQRVVDTLIVIPNQNLFRVANERTTFADAFKMADDVLYSGVRGVTDLMVMPGLINLDFADIRTVMSEMGKAMMGTGEAEGDSRAIDAAQKAISNPLLDDVSMKGARGVLINITGGPDMTLFEVDEAANRIRDEVDPEANIIFGSTFDVNMEGRMRVTVVATGIDLAVAVEPRPQVINFAARGPNRPAGVMPRNDGATAFKMETMAPPAPAVAETPAPAMMAAPAPEPAIAVAPVAAAQAEPASAAIAVPATLPQAGPASQATAAPAGLPVMPARQPAPHASEHPFIAPRPIAAPPAPPAARVDRPAAPDPFNEAALTNGAREPAKPRGRLPSLFERVTGTGRARQQAAEAARTAPPAPSTPAAPAAPTAPAAAPAAPAGHAAPAQTRLGGLDPSDRLVPSASQDDLLDIPAFLRRQAN